MKCKACEWYDWIGDDGDDFFGPICSHCENVLLYHEAVHPHGTYLDVDGCPGFKFIEIDQVVL